MNANNGVCPWCDFTAEACRASAAGGYIKCCPDCDHRRPYPSCLPSLGESCGNCHRCTPPEADS